MWSSSIYKANFIQRSDEKVKVIDSNDRVARAVEDFAVRIKEAEPEPEQESTENDGFSSLPLDELILDRDENMNVLGEDNGNPDEGSEEPYEETPEEISERCAKMISDAKEEAGRMIADAAADIDESRQAAYEAGMQEGYEEGLEKAREEYEEKLEELNRKEESLILEYNERFAEMEPLLVDAVSEVYNKVFGRNFYDNRGVITYLINHALMRTDMDDEIVINLSENDYEAVSASKDRLFARIGFRTEPEIRISPDLSKGQAKIETGHGIIDCSIDTELKELTKALHAMTWAGDRS